MQSINMRGVKFINISLDRIANCLLSLLMKVEMIIQLSMKVEMLIHLSVVFLFIITC